jgi:hypothetical protein
MTARFVACLGGTATTHPCHFFQNVPANIVNPFHTTVMPESFLWILVGMTANLAALFLW